MARNRQSSPQKSYSAPPPAVKAPPPVVRTVAPPPQVSNIGSGSTFMSSMAGSVAGSYIGNKLFSNSSAPQETAPANKSFPESGLKSSIFNNTQKCIEDNPYDYNKCKFYIDELLKNDR